MSERDGGPAFARAGCTWTDDYGDGAWSQDGMSLRDYFAAHALAGMMARDAFDPGQSTPQLRARLAYIEADAMLAERAK